jgi:8-oxo-dGTP pyrophosphatase MutT (NUDIX family)
MPANRPRIRPIAIAVFRDGDRILVFEGHDPTKHETFYRPLGGGIEFGERAQDCLAREIREELRAEIADVTYLGTLQNIFTCDGQVGHEIVLVYETRFIDARLYHLDVLRGQDDGKPFVALWKSLEEFREGQAPLYPDGLLDLLDGHGTNL